MLSNRSHVTVEQVREELAELEREYEANRVKLLADFKRDRAGVRRVLLAEFAAKGRVLRAQTLSQINKPYKAQRKRLQKFLDVLEGEQGDQQPAEPEPPESSPEPLKLRKKKKGR